MEAAWRANPGSGILASDLIGKFAKRGDLDRSEEVYVEFRKHEQVSAALDVGNTLVEALPNAGPTTNAEQQLDQPARARFGWSVARLFLHGASIVASGRPPGTEFAPRASLAAAQERAPAAVTGLDRADRRDSPSG